MSGFVSIREMQKQITPMILAPIRSHLYDIEKAINPEYIESSALSVLQNTTADAFIIHSLDDDTVVARHHYLKLKCALEGKENISFLTLTDRGHNPTYTADAVKYKDAFFKEFKKRTRKGKPFDMEMHKQFLASYDWHRMTAQDAEIWQKIYDFLDK